MPPEVVTDGDQVDLAARTEHPRLPLDVLVARMTDQVFVLRHRRLPSSRESSGHVSPSILAVSSPRSRYVRGWRRHARRCPACADVFRYLGLPI